MKRDKVIERLKAGEKMALGRFASRYTIANEVVDYRTVLWLRRRRLIVASRDQDGLVFYRWFDIVG